MAHENEKEPKSPHSAGRSSAPLGEMADDIQEDIDNLNAKAIRSRDARREQARQNTRAIFGKDVL